MDSVPAKIPWPYQNPTSEMANSICESQFCDGATSHHRTNNLLIQLDIMEFLISLSLNIFENHQIICFEIWNWQVHWKIYFAPFQFVLMSEAMEHMRGRSSLIWTNHRQHSILFRRANWILSLDTSYGHFYDNFAFKRAEPL